MAVVKRNGAQCVEAAFHLADFIDFAHLERYTMGEPQLTEELLGLFCKELHAWPDVHASEEAECAALHRLKGAARGVGAFPLAEAAAWLEQLLRAGASEAELRDARLELRIQLDGLKDACRRWKVAEGL